MLDAKKIYDTLQDAEEWVNAGKTGEPEKTYEQGVAAALQWVSGANGDAPDPIQVLYEPGDDGDDENPAREL
jgi:hypothetical protein